MTLTRERLDYTKHCFRSLKENAGCVYDHYVLDQGSTDGTPEWLLSDPLLDVLAVDENIGCCRGWNALVELAMFTGRLRPR
jgi:GT2 family glycosyltransferase